MIMTSLVIPSCPCNHCKYLQEPFRDGPAMSNTEKNIILYKSLKKKRITALCMTYFIHDSLLPKIYGSESKVNAMLKMLALFLML